MAQLCNLGSDFRRICYAVTNCCEKGSRAEPWEITKVKLETEAGLLRWRLQDSRGKTSSLKNISSQSNKQGADRADKR